MSVLHFLTFFHFIPKTRIRELRDGGMTIRRITERRGSVGYVQGVLNSH